jgi:hypothetical protein
VTLVEFLAQLKQPKQRDQVLAVLYYLRRYQDEEAVTVERIRTSLGQARVRNVKRMNIAQVLSASGELVDTKGAEAGRKLWALTDSGIKHVRDLLGLPSAEIEIEHDVATLSDLAATIKDQLVRGYVEEAITCLQAGALRAAVVFLWTGAIRTLHDEALAIDSATVNAAIKKQDPKARNVSRIEHFGWIGDRVFLEAAPDVGLLDKGQKDTLVDALNLRNRCGHPTKYKPGEAKAKSFIEDVVGIVFK